MTKEQFSKGGKRALMLVSLLLLVMATFAVPAKPGLTRLLTLTDGTTINATLMGDEYLHYWLGEDGKAYQAVSKQERGLKGGSNAGDAVYQIFNLESAKESAAERRNSANQRRARRLAPSKVGDVGNIIGQKKGIIILVNFTDETFSATQSDFYNLANTVNYNSGNYKGSMYDYFYAQSEGKFRLTFDVVGPYTVSENCAYYGGNNSNGDDLRPGEMVKEAVQLANNDVNFADYDWDNDGYVDQVYVVYAGKGEADGGNDDTIWPHEWSLYSATGSYITLDGKKIDTYACGGEQDGSTGETAGIGTMCHEFSHCLGYPDFYDTDYSGGQGMGYWDLMDSGSYNGNGYQPAGYTSYERWVAGWKTPIELEYTQTISNMAALQTTGSNTYIIYNKGNNNEYYLLENRQKTGWDTSLPGEGLLILHVDYSSSAWSNNTANDTPSHQRMTWIAADNNYQYTMYNGTKYYTTSGMATDPFPQGSVNAFGKSTTPAAKLYNKNSDDSYYLDSSVEDITQNSNGTVSFYFRGISNVALPVISPDEGRFTNDQTVTVTITAETGAAIYYTTNGDTPTATSTLYTAPFTLNATTTVKAIAVKDGEDSGVATATYTFIDPLIVADESLSFSAEAGSSETKQLTVLTEGLTQDVTLTLTDANGVFSLSTNTISKSQEEATVNVTFSPTAAGNYSGTITLTSAGADPVTVSLSATATLSVPATPAGLTLSEVASTSLTASWSAVDGAESYEIDVVEGSSFTASSGEPVLESDFSDTTDWELSGTGTYTGAGYYGSGSPSIKFDGTGDYAISPDFGSGTKLQFWALGNNGTSTFAISGLVNGSWQDIETVTIAKGGATYEVNLPSGTSQVRFDFTKTVNCALDDVKVFGPSSSPVSVDGYPKSVGNVTSYAVTGLTSDTQYAVRVRAVNSGGNSDWSATATATTTSAPVWSALPTDVSLTVGEEYLLKISDYVSGNPAPTISMTPPTHDDSECDGEYFIFVPTEAGTFNFTFIATNIEGSAEATLTVTVSAAQASSGDVFALVTSADDFEEGDYIIVYNNGAMKASVSSNRLEYTDVTPTNDVITTDDASIIWHIAPSGNYYTIYNAGENKYAASTGTKNQAQLLADGTDDKSLWSVTTGTTFDFTNKYNEANNVNARLRRNDTYGFACYALATGGALSLYKRTGGSTPIDPTLAYYQNADGFQGSALKTAMSGIIYNRTEKSYDYLWTAFQSTDVRNDGKIWDMYSNATNYEPGGSAQGAEYAAEGDSYNREHSFPKSWFGGDVMPMYTDLHHIYPTDGYVNNKRANYPFGETDGTGQGSYQSNDGFSKLGTCTYPGYTGIVFEPDDEYKGDFARTYFYMVTCYEEKLADWYAGNADGIRATIDGSTYPALTQWQLNMLMEWAKNDPVSEKEINRNNAVYAIQNNRNPFIDYPGLQEYIWGICTNDVFDYDDYVEPVYSTPVTVPELAIGNITDNSADASWTACDGVTEYTLQLASDDQFIAASPIFSEDFSGFTVTGSNDISTSLDNYTATAGWTGSNVYCNNGEAKIGANSGIPWIMTPKLTASGSITVVFNARRYGTSDQGTLSLGISEDGFTFSNETIDISDEMTVYTKTFTVSGSSVYVRWMGSASSKARFYLDDVSITTSGGSLIAEYTVSGTEYSFTDLEPETTYYARVKGNADWSTVVDFTTDAAPNQAPVLTASQGTSVSAVFGDIVEFTVTATGNPAPTVTMDATEYDAIFENGEFIFAPDAVGTYAFTFNAENIVGIDQLTVTVTVTAAPVTVPELTVTDITDTTANAIWTACNGVTEYTVQLASDDQFSNGGGDSVELINEGFVDGTLPDGWTVDSGSLGGTYTTNGNFGSASPSLKLSNTVTLSTPTLSNPTGISFWYKGNGNSFTSTLVVEQLVDGVWGEVGSASISGSAATFTHDLNPAATQVRFVFTKNSGNVAFDDVVINGTSFGGGSLIAEYTVPGTDYTFTGLTPETTYFARVKGNADWSDTKEFITEEAPAPGIAPAWSTDFPATWNMTAGDIEILDAIAYLTGDPTPVVTFDTDAPVGDYEYKDGALLYSPTQTGTFTFTFTADNGVGEPAVATLVATVTGTLPFWFDTFPGTATVAVGEEFEFPNVSSYAFGTPSPTIELASAPASVSSEDYSFDAECDYFLFTPKAPGNYEFVFRAENVLGSAFVTLTVTVPAVSAVLANNDSEATKKNSAIIADNHGKVADVTLQGRTLYKDGEWNTICLPFDVTISESPLADAEARTLTAATLTGTHVELTFGDQETTLSAGVPYIIRWDANGSENLVEPTFVGVTINKSTEHQTLTFANDNVQFIGYYDAFHIDANDEDVYYLTSGNTFKHTAAGRTLYACRAYFRFSEAAQARQFVLNFGEDGGTTTGILEVDNGTNTDDSTYDLLGRKVDGKQSTVRSTSGRLQGQNGKLRKGLYIRNGKKVVVK